MAAGRAESGGEWRAGKSPGLVKHGGGGDWDLIWLKTVWGPGIFRGCPSGERPIVLNMLLFSA